MRRWIVLALLSVGIGSVSAACKAKAGDECKPNTAQCATKSEALFCRGGALVPAICANNSCKPAGESVVCDQTQGEMGQTCILDTEYACSKDGITGLQCLGGSFKKNVVCRGPKGCKMENQRIACDASVANVGDACTREDVLACADDKKTLLRCKLKTFEVYRPCRGPKGCVTDDTLPQCDNSLASLEDPCAQPGRVACSVDKSKELLCQGGRFTFSRDCKNGCSVSVVGGSITCK